MKDLVILRNLLSPQELNALDRDCSKASSRFITHEQYAETSCAIDLFERSSLEDERIRTNRDRYFEERWKNYVEDSSQLSSTKQYDILTLEDKDIIRSTLCCTLPKALNVLLNQKELFLFNEHYVVKPPQSQITFRWHRDADEQLQFCYDQNVEYYSLWCPLDDVDEGNGTLQVPHGTKIRSIDVSEISDSSNFQPEEGTTINELHSSHVEFLPPPGKSNIDHQSDYLHSSEAPPLSVSVPRGSAVVFSSLMWHCSGPNTSNYPRRVVYVQYSEDIITHEGGAPTATTGKRKWQDDQTASRSSTTPAAPSLPLCFAIPCDCSGSSNHP